MARWNTHILMVLQLMLPLLFEISWTSSWNVPSSNSAQHPLSGSGNGIEKDGGDQQQDGSSRQILYWQNRTHGHIPFLGSLLDQIGNQSGSVPGFVPEDSRSAVCHAQCAAKCEDIRVNNHYAHSSFIFSRTCNFLFPRQLSYFDCLGVSQGCRSLPKFCEHTYYLSCTSTCRL